MRSTGENTSLPVLNAKASGTVFVGVFMPNCGELSGTWVAKPIPGKASTEAKLLNQSIASRMSAGVDLW